MPVSICPMIPTSFPYHGRVIRSGFHKMGSSIDEIESFDVDQNNRKHCKDNFNTFEEEEGPPQDHMATDSGKRNQGDEEDLGRH